MNYLLVTHDLRLRYFLQTYFTKDFPPAFGNGCVLRLTLTRKCASIQMLFPGYEANGKLASVKFSALSIPTRTLIGDTYLYRNINIYIVRHGIGEHNVALYQRCKNPDLPELFFNDPRLVRKGKLLLKKSMAYLPKTIDLIFASTLVRTRETLAVLLKHYPNRTMYIVPGAAEIYNRNEIQLEVPLSQHRNIPKTFTIEWNMIPPGKNMIDEIVKGQQILKIENKIKNHKDL